MATSIPAVVDGEIIATSWGNQVRSEVSTLDSSRVLRAGDTMTATLRVGGDPDANVAGTEVHPYGQIVLYSTGANANLFVVRQNADPGEPFARFHRHSTTAGTTPIMGSITQVGTSGVAYNTTSDYRLKNDLGPIVDGLTRLNELVAHRITWKDDPDLGEQDGLLAHEVATVAPYAVQGAKDAVDGDGNIVAQQLDTARLVPLLIAAVQELSARLAALEGGV